MEARNNPKSILRKEILSIRDSLTKEELEKASIAITDRILGHQWFYRSEILLAFASYGSEINTFEIINEALRKGKKVFLPRIEGEYMNFYRVLSLDDLEEGYKGILEPKGTVPFDYEAFLASGQMGLILMPGVVFDVYRNRIGYGKGFYDKFLADKPVLRNHSLGIGHKCQQVEEITCNDENDIKPYQVILV